MSCFKKKKLSQTAPNNYEALDAFTPTLKVSGLQYNTFVIEDGSTSLLIDPWLTGNLTVGDELMPCLFKGTKQKPMGLTCEDVTPERFDAIVLTQFF